jgi:leader peptidase (prepilin peptidase)/N-methyltransferase
LTVCLYPLAGILLMVFPPIRLTWWPAIFLLTYLGIVAIIDLEHRVILQEISLVGVVIGGCYGIFLHGWQTTLIGGAAGYGLMLAIFLFGILFTRIMTKIKNQETDEVALGFGDVNLAGILGLILGWPGILLGLIFGIIAGGLASGICLVVLKIIKKYESFIAIPYAPYLILGAIILLYRPG